MTDNHFSGELGRLPEADITAYEQAIDIYETLVALLNARADREPDPVAAEQWRADAVRYAAEQRQLRAGDQPAAQRVISQYPKLVRELRAALTE